MMDIKGIKFVLQGKAFGKERPIFVKVGRFTKAITPEKTRAYENYVKAEYARQCRGCFFPEDRALAIDFLVHVKPPKSTSKRKTADMLLGLYYPAHKPDCDNILKVICDGLNQYAYHDDHQIVRMSISKIYSEQEIIEVTIQDLGMAG